MEDLTTLIVDGRTVGQHNLDVTVVPPTNANEDLTDEDSGAEDNPIIDNVPKSQLQSKVAINITNQDSEEILEADTSSNTDPCCSQYIKRSRLEQQVSPAPPEVRATAHGVRLLRRPIYTILIPQRSLHQSRVLLSPSFALSLSCGSPAKSSFVTLGTKKTAARSFNWAQNELLQTMGEFPAILFCNLEPGESPLEYFCMLFDHEVLNLLVKNTNQYAAKQNLVLNCSENEILLLSGYAAVPRKNMYRQKEPDAHNELISNGISRDRFQLIMSNINACDNDNLKKSDRFAKIRPLLDILNPNFREFAPHEEFHSVNESMVPYFGGHRCKQFIKGKPIQFGFKSWCGGKSTGYLNWLEPHQGANTLGYSVVTSYADLLPKNIEYTIFFDNFFTSFDLLFDLKEKGKKTSGTIRSNSISKYCLLKDPKIIKPLKRGYWEYV